MEKYNDLIEKIKNHKLGNKEEATALYFAFCACLKEKYGLVDRDFDDNPTKRGKEWIDIHHIREYELDDIARRTDNARYFERRKRNSSLENQVVIAMKASEWNNAKMEEISKQYPDRSVTFLGIDYTLEELKPYNVKEQLVYANKIEHFLLHYLINSILQKSGGVHYLWDCSVALDLYGFEQAYMQTLKNDKETFYSILTSEEITFLYKKLIDWEDRDINECSRYWVLFKDVLHKTKEQGISYVENKERFFKLFRILNYPLDKKYIDAIKSLPYFADAKKTAAYFVITPFERKSFTIPNYVKNIAFGAFDRAFYLETVTIPITVEHIDDTVFVEYKIKAKRIAKISKIIYKGTIEEWNKKFSNVELGGIKLVCKKK